MIELLIETLRELIAAVVMLTAALTSSAAALPADHPADACHEDQAWTAVDYRDPLGVEDIHGVTRRCVNVDEMEPREMSYR